MSNSVSGCEVEPSVCICINFGGRGLNRSVKAAELIEPSGNVAEAEADVMMKSHSVYISRGYISAGTISPCLDCQRIIYMQILITYLILSHTLVSFFQVLR